MAYRFVLDVPEAAHEDAKAVISSVRDAQVLIDRHPHPNTPDPVLDSADAERAELTVSAHTLDVIDALYAWMGENAINTDVYIEAFNGGRVHLSDHDAKALRRMVQGDQYWFENTVPRIHYTDPQMMEGGARVSDVPYGGRSASGLAVLPSETRVELGAVDHVAVRVRDLPRAEAFYRDFFGMDVIYRARNEQGRWQHLPADYDWVASIHTGVFPEIVRLENGSVALVLINVGAGAVMHESRVAHISLSAPLATLNALRGRALFSSFTSQEDSASSVRFVDPFGVTWQIIASNA
nr:glyoxalase/Bleomycin resistance protein/Dioxygenase superfamily [uncultured bacterium]